MIAARTVAFKTLGCRLNQFESDSVMTGLAEAGYRVVEFAAGADVYIINTCTITSQSDRKSKSSINQAVKRCRPGSVVVVTGCMVGSQKAYLEARSDITYVVENSRKRVLPALLEAHFGGEPVDPGAFEAGLFDFRTAEKGIHTRSAIKIQDGCDNFCAYCIVPMVRGRAASRPAGDVLAHVRRTLETGARELILTGVNIGRYDDRGLKFDGLVEKLVSLPGDFRIRISSIEPEGVTDRLVHLFENPKLCPHLHLCLQSGSESVLKRMRRAYTAKAFMATVDRFRAASAQFNFTTDIIVGFPGETRADVEATLAVVRAAAFSHIHTFKYSRRAGTLADRMPDQVPAPEKQRRSEQVRQLADQLKREYRLRMLGGTQRLLVERNASKSGARGYGEHYLPLVVPDTPLGRNQFYDVRLTGMLEDRDCTITAVCLQPPDASR